jgi:RNA polymerase sigma-70 factor (ECF subfamily)
MTKRTKKGDGLPPEEVEAMEGLMAEHETGLLRYATRILNDLVAAQDVVQDAFIKLFLHSKSGKEQTGKASSWLYRVTHNNAIDYIRRESRLRDLHRKTKEEACAREGTSQLDEMSSDDKMEMVMKHLRVLKPHEQQVLVLRLQEGKSYREIGDITKRSEGNVGCILHHAVQKLSDSLNKAGAVKS